MSSIAGANCAIKARPASVSATLRFERANSGMPSRSSTSRTAWLTFDDVMPNCLAAAEKPFALCHRHHDRKMSENIPVR